MKKVVVLGLLILVYFNLAGQERITNNHFFLNPYIYNPAFAGDEGRASLALNHRQQWRGIEDAPVTSYISFDVPIKNTFNFGIKIINDQKSILNTTTGFVTAGYTVLFRGDRSNALSFGLSGGIAKQSLASDEELNFNDPAVIGLYNSRTHFLGEFGLYYQNNALKIGFALPALMNPQLTKSDLGLDPLNEMLFSITYPFMLSEKVLAFEPYLLYRMRADLPGQFEGTGIFRFYDTFWIGGNYRQDYGASALVGLRLSDHLEFGYAYELASSQVTGYANGSHELHLSIDFGEVKKKPESRKPRFRF